MTSLLKMSEAEEMPKNLQELLETLLSDMVEMQGKIAGHEKSWQELVKVVANMEVLFRQQAKVLEHLKGRIEAVWRVVQKRTLDLNERVEELERIVGVDGEENEEEEGESVEMGFSFGGQNSGRMPTKDLEIRRNCECG